MIEWELVRKIAADTWGVTVLVCVITWLVAWVVGLGVRKIIKPTTEDKEIPGKDK